jgi:hypothetical protein
VLDKKSLESSLRENKEEMRRERVSFRREA